MRFALCPLVDPLNLTWTKAYELSYFAGVEAHASVFAGSDTTWFEGHPTLVYAR